MDDVMAFFASLEPRQPELCYFLETIELLQIISENEAIDLYDKFDDLMVMMLNE